MPPLVDDVAPAAPPGVRVSGNTAGVAVRWEAGSDDEGVDHYDVERDGQLIGSTPGLGFDDAGVASLVDAELPRRHGRHERQPRAVACGERDAGGRHAARAACRGSRCARAAANVTATWAPALDNRAIGAYRVFRNGVFVRNVRGSR